MVDHFRVLRMLGKGGMGEVYAARDMKLGRKVALKVVTADRFETKAMRERFVVEARATARFNHPNIVTIYAVGEHDTGPYLALELLEGENLSARMADTRLSQREALRVALAIAEALAEAHRHGVLHRDLKPGNVLIGRDGRVRVLDFGLAKIVERAPDTTEVGDADTLPPSSRRAAQLLSAGVGAADTFGPGTPKYMAPEQWQEEPAAEASDVWALGIVMYIMLAGHHPYEGLALAELAFAVGGGEKAPGLRGHAQVTEDIEELVAQCLEKEPALRPTSARLVARLSSLIAGEARAIVVGENPFRGLASFTREHEHLYFGRDAEIAAFVERARIRTVLPVVGPSGSGKSSFVQAGVIPRLMEQEHFSVLSMRPGTDPFAALASRLLLGEDAGGSGPQLRRAHDAPTRVRRNRPRGDEPTRTDGGLPVLAQAEAAGAALTATGSHRVEVTELAARLRDNPGQLGFELGALAEAQSSRVLLFVDQMEEVFTLAQDDAGARAFVELLCSATDDPLDPVRIIFTIRDDFLGRLAVSPSASEILGHVTLIQRPDAGALEETLIRPIKNLGYTYDDPELARDMVRAVAGEQAALPLLQFAASLLWERRDREGLRLTRAAYVDLGGVEGALARHADGVLAALSDDEPRVARQLLLRLVTPDRTRKVVTRDQALDGLGARGSAILARFIEARLLSTIKFPEQKGGVMLELAHESLLRTWATLARWVDESHEDVVLFGQLEQAARFWHERGKAADQLWRGEALDDAVRMRARAARVLPRPVREFIAASERVAKRQQRRRRALGALAVVAAVAIAVTAVVVAVNIAEQRDRAEQRRAEALREGARAALAQRHVLEARAKLRESLEIEDTHGSRAQWRKLEREPLVWQLPSAEHVVGVAISHDGMHVAAGGSNGVALLVATETRAHRALRGHADQILSVSFSPDDKTLATSSLDNTVRLWSVATGALERVLRGHTSAVHTARFSPDGARLVAGGYDGSVRVWEVASGRELAAMRGHAAAVRGVAYSPDGKLVASGDARGVVRLWSAESGRDAGQWQAHELAIYGVEFARDGRLVATSSLDSTVRLWDVATRTERAVLREHGAAAQRIAFAPDGKRLVSTGLDGQVIVWDVATASVVGSYPHASAVSDAAFDGTGKLLATASLVQGVSLYRADVPATDARLAHEGTLQSAVISPDGEWLASADRDGRVGLWQASTGRLVRLHAGHQGKVNDVAFSPDGKRLVSAGDDGLLRSWTSAGKRERALFAHSAPLSAVAFADARSVVVAAHDGAARVVDVETGETRWSLPSGSERIHDIAIAKDGKRAALASYDGSVRLWSLAAGTLVRKLAGGGPRIYGVVFHPSGEELVTSDADGNFRRWPVGPDAGDSPVPIDLERAPTRCYRLAFDDEGTWLAAPCADGTVRLIPTAGGATVVVEAHRDEVNTVRFGRRGSVFVTASDDRTVRLWDAATMRPRWSAAALVPPALAPSAPALLYSQLGWTEVDGTPAGAPRATCRGAVEAAAASSVSDDGARLCVATLDGHLVLADLANDRELSRAPLTARSIVATESACYASTPTDVVRLDASGARSLGISGCSALGQGDGLVAMGVGDEVRVVDAAGVERHRIAEKPGVSALAMGGGVLAIGHRDGQIVRRDLATGEEQELEATARSLVERIVRGPGGVWIAGFANGDVGMWDGATAQRLDHARLHGPVGHLLVSGRKLYAASTLGDGLAWDLGDLEGSRCDLLRKVRREVPVVWRNGRAVTSPPRPGVCP